MLVSKEELVELIEQCITKVDGLQQPVVVVTAGAGDIDMLLTQIKKQLINE